MFGIRAEVTSRKGSTHDAHCLHGVWEPSTSGNQASEQLKVHQPPTHQAAGQFLARDSIFRHRRHHDHLPSQIRHQLRQAR